MALPKFEKDISYISKLADQPNDTAGGELSAAQLKARFDAAGNDLKAYINDVLIPAIANDIAAAAEGISGGSQIGEDKIADGAVTSGKIAALAVLTSAIADLAVTNAKIADGAVTENKIADGAITNLKIAQGSVARDKIADEAVSADKIYPLAVTNSKIANDAVGTLKIADAAVTRAKLANDALYSPMRTVDNRTITERTITASDMGGTFTEGYIGSPTVKYTFSQEVSTTVPRSADFAVFQYASSGQTEITFSGVRLCGSSIDGQISAVSAPVTLRLATQYTLVAFKKWGDNTSGAGDLWMVIGDVEVVS